MNDIKGTKLAVGEKVCIQQDIQKITKPKA